MKHHRRHAGFSLVELAFSLGIAAFVLTSVLGLLSLGVSSGQESLNDTILSTMTNEVVSEMRGQVFVDATPAHQPGQPGVLPGTQPTAAAIPSSAAGVSPSSGSSSLPMMYFDDSGARLRDPVEHKDYLSAASALQAGAIYQCTVSLQPDRDTLGKLDATSGLSQVNLVNAVLDFRWPVASVAPTPPPDGSGSPSPSPTVAPNKLTGHRSVLTSIARY